MVRLGRGLTPVVDGLTSPESLICSHIHSTQRICIRRCTQGYGRIVRRHVGPSFQVSRRLCLIYIFVHIRNQMRRQYAIWFERRAVDRAMQLSAAVVERGHCSTILRHLGQTCERRFDVVDIQIRVLAY